MTCIAVVFGQLGWLFGIIMFTGAIVGLIVGYLLGRRDRRQLRAPSLIEVTDGDTGESRTLIIGTAHENISTGQAVFIDDRGRARLATPSTFSGFYERT
jgi:MFS family permease